MKYQALKHLKTKSKLLGIFPTIADAREAIRQADPRATRQGDSYMGGFPYYHDTATQDARPYTIQGMNENYGIVCSIPAEEKAKLRD